MELWIRSQDKETLMKANYFEMEQRDKNFLIMARNGDPYFDQCLGLYKTKKRALEVLDEIQNILKPITVFKNAEISKETWEEIQKVGVCTINDRADVIKLDDFVYEMPKE